MRKSDSKTSPPYNQSMYKACIFDLDGTIINTLLTVHHYCNVSLENFGFASISEAECQNLCRLPIGEFYHELLRLGNCPEIKVAELAPQIRDFDIINYSKDPFRLSYPYQGITELIQKLRDAGAVLGVLTNKPDAIAQRLVNNLFPGKFDKVIGQTPTSISKPDPRCLTNFIETLGQKKEDCLYVGDSDIDMITAKDANVAVAAVTWGFQSREHLLEYNPEYIVSTPAELQNLFNLNL